MPKVRMERRTRTHAASVPVTSTIESGIELNGINNNEGTSSSSSSSIAAAAAAGGGGGGGGIHNTYIESRKEKKHLRHQRWMHKLEGARRSKQEELRKQAEKANPILHHYSLNSALTDISPAVTTAAAGRQKKKGKHAAVDDISCKVTSRKGRQHASVVEVQQFNSIIGHPAFKGNAVGAIAAHVKAMMANEASTAANVEGSDVSKKDNSKKKSK